MCWYVSFHLLEFLDVDYQIDVDELNAGWARPGAIDEWSQFILKDTADLVEEFRWPGMSWEQRFDAFSEGKRVVELTENSAA